LTGQKRDYRKNDGNMILQRRTSTKQFMTTMPKPSLLSGFPF